MLIRQVLITPVKQNEKRTVHKVSIARPVSTTRHVSTVRPFAPKIAQTNGAIRPIYPRMDNWWIVVALANKKATKHIFLDYEDYNGGFVAFGSESQLKDVPVPLDHFLVPTLTKKVLTFMVKKGKNFSRKATPLFDFMLVQQTKDEGEASERPSDSQPIPSPTNPREEICQIFQGRTHLWHKDPKFEDLDDFVDVDDTLDYMETEDDQDEGRTSSVVLEEKESADKEVSIEAPVSIVKPNEGTDKRNKAARSANGFALLANLSERISLTSFPSNIVANPRGDVKAITTQSGISYDGPPIPPPFSPLPKVVEQKPEVTKDTMQPSTENIQPPVVQIQAPFDEPIVVPKPKPFIPYPSRANKQKLHEKDDNLASKFVEIFREITFRLTKTPVNENCSTVILKKLHEKLRDPGNFLIPCDFPEIVKCLALADLGASINLMPLSIWKNLSLPELTPTRMILELADRSTTSPSGIAEDVFVKVGKFHFPADFVVVDYVDDPRVPLILGRPFLRTARTLIDVYGEELTLRVNDEAITFKVGQTSRYSYNNAKSVNRIDVIDVSYPILSTSFPSLTPFKGSDFILEEIEACLTNDSIPPGINDADFDPEGDLLLL
ncbi:reverse transcriptase domain-containing protein [Tanacetum coccineum]